MMRYLLAVALVFVLTVGLITVQAPMPPMLPILVLGAGGYLTVWYLWPERDHGDVGEHADAADHGQGGGDAQ